MISLLISKSEIHGYKMPSTYITKFVQVLYEVRLHPPLRDWHKNISSPTPCDLLMFRFMITFASCFPIDKDHIQNIAKMQGRSHYLPPHRRPPYLRNVSHHRALSYTKRAL
jgi:hypothetical protein